MHIGFVPAGSKVSFPNSGIDYLKVCDEYDGTGAVVDTTTGKLIRVSRLEENGLDPEKATIVNESIWG